jgi:predicted nuclease with TOPRIM domain
LLEQKYKEEKAQVGRMQREKLILEGQVRQAKMDLEKVEKEKQQLLSSSTTSEKKLKKQLNACENTKDQLSESLDELQTTHADLTKRHQQTIMDLEKRVAEVHKLTNENASLNSELKRSISQSNRYLAHNEKLSMISQELVGRIEQKELGSSILVKEPLVQFERVELEKILQEYLDKIDEEKIIP